MTNTITASVIGLGSMGFGVGLSLLREGNTVHGFDVDKAQLEKFLEAGGQDTTMEVAGSQADIVIAVVLNAAQLESVLFGPDGIVPYMRPDTCVIACPTVAPEFAKEMESKCHAHEVHYLDAPISGGSVKAASGQLSVMASGTPGAFTAAEPALKAIAETVFRLGDSAGNGSAMKAVNQLLAGVHIATMAEAMTFGISQGIEPAQIVDVISQCAGTSWMFENRAPHIVNGDYTPYSSINIWPKDLGIVLDIARDAKFPVPMTAAALQQFRAAADAGLGQEDDAAVAKVYARNSDIKLP